MEQWRKKAVDGTITVEEMRECIEAIRVGRASAASRKTTSTKKPAVSLEDLENELDAL
jgi:hypothetical protein